VKFHNPERRSSRLPRGGTCHAWRHIGQGSRVDGCRPPPPVAGQGFCLAGANYSTLLKWHLGVPLLPADCAGRPCPLGGGLVDIFGDHAVSCKKSGFGDRHLGSQSFFCQVLTQTRIPHDREVDIAGTADAQRTSCRRRGTGGGTSRWT